MSTVLDIVTPFHLRSLTATLAIISAVRARRMIPKAIKRPTAKVKTTKTKSINTLMKAMSPSDKAALLEMLENDQ